MAQFVKKAVVIDADQWTGEPVGAVKDLIDMHGWHVAERSLFIKTLEGEMEAQPGDWIIRGVEGEYYPCKPSIFEKTYERVSY